MYSKVQHLENRLSNAGVSFDAAALPEVEGGAVTRPDFGELMPDLIDNHHKEHGKAKTNHKCGENPAMVALIKEDISKWRRQEAEGMRYVSALGQLLVKTHDASGH